MVGLLRIVAVLFSRGKAGPNSSSVSRARGVGWPVCHERSLASLQSLRSGVPLLRLYCCFCELGVLFLGVLTIRAPLFESMLGPLI